MPALTEFDRWPGRTVVGRDGEKIGTISTLYVEPSNTERPAYAAVHTGLFGTKTTVVPLDKASVQGDKLAVPLTREQVKDAPRIDSGEDISPRKQEEINAYYGFGTGRTVRGSAAGTAAGAAAGTMGGTFAGSERADQRTVEADESATGQRTMAADERTAGQRGMEKEQRASRQATSATDQRAGAAQGRAPDERERGAPVRGAEGEMTRSEERLRISTETVETGRARLHKYVVTENVRKSVPFSHEEVRLERETITDADRAAIRTRPELTEQDQEVTLHAERPVIQKETVPVERVRLTTERVTEERQIEEQLRHEEINMDVDESQGRSGEQRPRRP
ncbi:conserved domain-containing protein [Parafrankia irregularis]|uniref:Conserved domain-containing protein n=1 Tax=Parafrankia irregularis TaxID=795642 RepID=A0A0S4QSP9_9ACTN|nr:MULTISPECIES: DUF2382 domain-containing protein [Parafrankia]MBE3201770.1 DUF2382 domain-containing protein [Parafrankia sp. CH37]CUU58249.1 conserved domain-containing protein [Parafrankia irregularis]